MNLFTDKKVGRFFSAWSGQIFLLVLISCIFVVSLHTIIKFIPFLFSRFTYPADLEWMEGGVMTHIIEIGAGNSLYREPSVDFIPFAYTPFYYYVSYAFSIAFKLSYQIPRAISLLSIVGTGLITSAIIVRVLKPLRFAIPFAILAGTVVIFLILLDFFFTGTFLDLARVDAFFLFLLFGGLGVLIEGRSIKSTIFSGLLLSLAFWTKQTAFFFIITAGLWLFFTDLKRFITLVITVGIAAGIVAIIYNIQTDGWLWFYIREIHKTHSFNSKLFWPDTAALLISRHAVMMLIIISSILYFYFSLRTVPDKLCFWGLMLLTAFFTSQTGMATQWAHTNALIPGSFFIVFVGLFSGILVLKSVFDEKHQLKRSIVALLITVLFCIHYFHVKPTSKEFQKHKPTVSDHIAASQLFLRLKKHKPDRVFIPYHPFLSWQLTGKHHFHMHALNDIRASGKKVPETIKASLSSGFFDMVIHDRKGHIYYRQLPGLETGYRFSGRLSGRRVKTWSGNPCGPDYLWLRK